MSELIKGEIQKTIVEKIVGSDEYGANVNIILTGDAPKQHNPKPVNLAGTITAPRNFAESRKEQFNPKNAHCKVCKSDGKITLVINEQDECNRMTIEGNVIIGKRFTELGINNTDVSYTPIGLSQKFRLLRSIFKDHTDHMKIVSTLKNLKAKVNQEIEKSKEDNGNRTDVFRQTVESNMPESFDLVIPLLEGEAPQKINVSVILEANSGTISCYLESIDAADSIETETAQRVEKEISELDSEIAIIYY